MSNARKIIAVGFVAVFLIPMIGTLFTADSKSLMALFTLILVSIAVALAVFNYMLSKSPNSLEEEWERAQDIIDRAMDGDIDQEFTINKHFVESELSQEEFWEMMQDEYEDILYKRK